MWQKYILPSAAVLALVITLTAPSASAETVRGQNHDAILIKTIPNGPAQYLWESRPERILDTPEYGPAVWRDYILKETETQVVLETANSGSLVFNKNTCSYDFHDSGFVDELNPPKVSGISWTVKGKSSASSTWTAVNTINNAACIVSVDTTESTVRLVGEKSAASGIFQIVLDYSPGKGIKETFRAYNNNPAWTNHNIGFTEKMDVPRFIRLGGTMYDLSTLNNTVLNRNWIENNEAKLVRLSDKIFYDFGIGFDNLNDIKITWDGSKASLALNYLYPTQIVPYQEWFEVDPTFGYTSGTSRGVETAAGAGTACPAGYVTSTSAGTVQSPDSGLAQKCFLEGRYWDITTIPDNSTIDTVNIRWDTGGVIAGTFDCAVNSYEGTMSTDSATVRWVDFRTGTNFTTTLNCDATLSNQVTDLGSAAASDLQAELLVDNEWGIGVVMVSFEPRIASARQTTFTDIELQVNYTIPGNPDAVEDLTGTVVSATEVDLTWTQPDLHLGTLLSYQLNYTTPFGDPLTPLANNSGTTAGYSVTGLSTGLNYSFRIGVQTNIGYNMSGNIYNVTPAFIPANFTIGDFNFDSTNPDVTPIRFERTDNNSTLTTLKVIYSDSYNMACQFDFEFSQQSVTYTSLTPAEYDTSHDYTDFEFVDPADEVISARCWDQTTNDTARYVITQSSFPFLEQLANFRAGAYGTDGTFGAFDLITLAVVIVSMIGFNRVNETVGGILNISLLAALAYYDIIELPTVIFGAIAVVVVVIVGSTRKD